MAIEWRVCWSASSNVKFRGTSEWVVWDGDQDLSAEEVEMELSDVQGDLGEGLAQAIDASGFEWWIETRAVDEDGPDAR